MEDTEPPPLILCMENASGEEVSLKIVPQDDFRTLLDKAKALLGFDVDINSITHNQPVCLTDNVYQYILNAEQNLTNTGDMAQTFDEMLEQSDSNDLVYILDDGTQIRASQIHFDNEDPPVDLTAENIPFVKYADCVDEVDIEHLNIEEKMYNIVESPVSKWSSKTSSPKCSFGNSLPFKLVCNNTTAFDAQFTKYLEASTKTYATLNPVANRNRSPRSLIKDNFKKLDDVQKDSYSYTREDILNMFKDSPVASLPYENQERRHVRKTDPSRLHKSWNRPNYVDIDGVLIGGSESQICFICGKHVDKNADKLYLFDNEDQKIHRCSPQKKMSTQLKIICVDCLNENFKPSRMKSANQFLNSDEYLVIRNNQQYIFQKTKNFKYNGAKIDNALDKHELIKFEIGSDGEIVTKPVDDLRSDVMIVKDERGSSSDVEIVEPESEIDQIVDNLDDADEEVKKFLGKYQCDTKELTELKCRFCDVTFPSIEAVIDHGEEHKHDLDDGRVYPCSLCDYGYATIKWLKGHIKAAHDKKEMEQEVGQKVHIEIVKEVSDTNAPDESSPIARRTRSSIKKTDFDRKDDSEKNTEDENKTQSTTELKEAELNREEKTEIKREEKAESSDDEIWIVHTADDEAAQELQRLIDAAKGEKKEGDGNFNETHKCLNCSEMFMSAEGFGNHKCRRRGRKRRTGGNDHVICIPTEEDFYKRAQGRPRAVNMSNNNDLLVPRCRKKKSKEASSDPTIVTCHNCSESFTSKVRLKFHMQFHSQSALVTSTGQYCCTDCDDITFATETELFDHVHFQHGKQKRWQCPVDGCGKTFYLRATLTKHSRTHTDTRRYVCVTCGKRFLDKQTLDEHGVTHLQIKPFQCHICLKQLTRRSRLRMHLRAHHEELAPRHVLVCAVCSRAFRDHMHAQEHATKSPECIEAFASELKEEAEEVTVQLSPTSGLVRHTVQIVESPKLSKPIQRQVASPVGAPLLSMVSDDARTIIRVVEIEKAFRCEFCEDVFYQEEGLNTHRVIHKGVKNPFTCHICKVSFATYSRCTTHKTTHGFYKRPLAASGTSSTPAILGYGDFPVVKHFLCEDCGRSYLHWTYLQVHRRMKHANENFLYKCNQCELTFPNSWSLAYHRKKIHGKTECNGTATRVSREDYRIPCRDCDEVLPNKTALYKHRKKEHSDMTLKMNCKPGCQLNRSSMQHIAVTDSDVTAPASCAHCGLTFAHAQELHTHLKSHHGPTDERDCATCGVGRAGASGASGAVGASGASGASGAGGHGCGVCGRAFRTSAMRTEHLRTHTDERPYPCDLCPLAFRRSSAMRNHRLIHSGVRPWPCVRCPKRFRVRSDLRTHLRLKHPATMAVIEIEGINPSPEDVVKYLTMSNIAQEKVLEISMISFPKGTSNIVPNSARALSMLSNVPRTQLALHRPTPPQPPPVEEFQPVRRGRGIAKNPRRPKILRGGDDSQDTSYPGTGNMDGQTLSDINVQLLLRDGVLVNGNQMVELQLDDPMLME